MAMAKRLVRCDERCCRRLVVVVLLACVEEEEQAMVFGSWFRQLVCSSFTELPWFVILCLRMVE